MFQSSRKKKKTDFVPYRDSVLTWLLRENLGKMFHRNNSLQSVLTLSIDGTSLETTRHLKAAQSSMDTFFLIYSGYDKSFLNIYM